MSYLDHLSPRLFTHELSGELWANVDGAAGGRVSRDVMFAACSIDSQSLDDSAAAAPALVPVNPESGRGADERNVGNGMRALPESEASPERLRAGPWSGRRAAESPQSSRRLGDTCGKGERSERRARLRSPPKGLTEDVYVTPRPFPLEWQWNEIVHDYKQTVGLQPFSFCSSALPFFLFFFPVFVPSAYLMSIRSTVPILM